uniref:Dystrophin n=1 Tax=Romanomermis culicivorax TaxID=13658 RepID=A0A915HH10_ROMCU
MCLFQSIPQSTAQLSFSPSESPVKESDPENSRKNSMPEAKRPKILPEEALSLTKKSAGDILQDYQSCLEEVLTWLLDAEETLKHMSDVESTELSKIKQQFKQHEDFMVNLTRNQSGIGDVLNKAGALLATDRLNEDEKSAIRKQVYMLNDKWEEIRMSAMQRQTK